MNDFELLYQLDPDLQDTVRPILKLAYEIMGRPSVSLHDGVGPDIAVILLTAFQPLVVDKCLSMFNDFVEAGIFLINIVNVAIFEICFDLSELDDNLNPSYRVYGSKDNRICGVRNYLILDKYVVDQPKVGQIVNCLHYI